MKRKLIIKIFKKRAKSNDIRSRVIVVTFNNCRVNGGYRFDRIGYIRYIKSLCFCYINLYKLGLWLNKGAKLKTKVSWLVGLLGRYESKLK